MKDNTTEIWFSWFYKKWEEYAPGHFLETGLSPSQIAERFVSENHNKFLEISNGIDEENYQALNEFMKLSESELHILKYFLKLIKLKKS